MKTTSKTLLALAMASAFGTVQAATIEQLFFLGQTNQLSDNSGEGQGIDVDGDGFLDIGDTLRGTFDWGTNEDLTGGGGTNTVGASGNNELSGIFVTEVKDMTPVDNGPDGVAGNGDDRFDFVFGPNAAFAAEFGLPAGAMIAMYEDTGPDYTRFGTLSDVEDRATVGAPAGNPLMWVLGFGGDFDTSVPNLGGATGDEQWLAFNAPQDPDVALLVPAGTGIGTFNFQLSTLLWNFPNTTYEQVGCTATGNVGSDGLCDVNAQGGILGTGGIVHQPTAGGTPYPVFNNVDMTFKPVAVVPEPATMVMLGLGLLGIGAARRRKAA